MVAAALLAVTLVAYRGDLRPNPVGIGAFCAGLAGLGLFGAFLLLFDGRPVSGEAMPPAGAFSTPRDHDALAPYSSVRTSREVFHG